MMTMPLRVALACVLCCPVAIADGFPGPQRADAGLAAPARGRAEPERGRGWWRPDPNRNYIVFTTILPASFASEPVVVEEDAVP